MNPIDEKSKRLPTFDGQDNEPVTFGDGGTWYLPRPHIIIFPIFADGKVSVGRESSFGPDFDALAAAARSATDAQFFVSMADLAVDLLRRNYALSDDDLSALLRYKSTDDIAFTWVGAVFAVAEGRSIPKRPAVA